jgi:hypothetical protein
MLLNPIPLLVGLILTPIAMTMIFLGAYEEYSRHFIDKKKPLKLAIEAAMFALLLFGAVTLAMGLIFKN